jgi:hypothetical protein
MKRMIAILGAVSLLTLMPVTPAAADTAGSSADADLGIIDFCKVDVPTNHPDLPLGSCISFQSTNFRDNVDGLIPHLCSYIQAVHPDLFDMFYDSFTDCVTDRASAFLD